MNTLGVACAALWVYCVVWSDAPRAVVAGFHLCLTCAVIVYYLTAPGSIGIDGLTLMQLLVFMGMVVDADVYWRYLYFIGAGLVAMLLNPVVPT